MKGNGKRESLTGKESKYFRMETSMKVNLKMDTSMVMEYLNGIMDQFTKDNSD